MAVGAVDDSRVKELGSRDPRAEALIRAWLPGANGFSGLAAHLSSQVLPRMIRQGDVRLVLARPDAKTIVGAVFIDERDVVAVTRRMSEIAADLTTATKRRLSSGS